MEVQLYMRVRGRVLGPYDRERLQALARRGQLSRMHELSEDGVSWVRASNHPELFVTENAPALAGQTGRDLQLAAPQGSAMSSPAGQQWYYTSAGMQRGPVGFPNLQQLARLGQLGPDDAVWTDGMPSWNPASQVAGLLSAASAAGSAATADERLATDAAEDGLDERLFRAAVDSRPWALSVAVILFVYAALNAVAGMYFSVSGAKVRAAPLVATGLFCLIDALLVTAAGGLILTYANRLGGLRYSRNAVVFQRALEALKAFWIFTSIVLIVLLAFLVFALVWAISIVGTI